MKRKELIEQLIRDTEEIKRFVNDEISILDESLLNERPGEGKWSIVECIEHMNIADGHYIKHITEQLNKHNEDAEAEVLKSGWLGAYFIKSIKPREDGSIPSPMKTLKKFIPEVDDDMYAISKFLSDQDTIIELLQKSANYNHNKIKITSAIGPIIKFYLGDAFSFFIAHNQRHIVQIKNILKELSVHSN